jgi:hypothetical protein
VLGNGVGSILGIRVGGSKAIADVGEDMHDEHREGTGKILVLEAESKL